MKCPTPGCDKEIDEKDFIEYISKEKEAAMKADALKEADKKIKEKEAAMKESAKKEADKKIKEKETEIRENAKKEAKREYKEAKDLQNKKHEIERKKWIDKFGKFQEQLDHQNPELKGAAQQQQIEDFLKDTFPNDDVDVIKKGENGADIIFTLFNKTTKLAPIYIESKNTASFSTGWPKKLFNDMKERNIEYGVLVTKTLPGDWGDEEYFRKIGNGIVILPMHYGYLKLFIEQSKEIFKANLNSKKNINVKENMKQLIEFFTGSKFRMYLRSVREKWALRKENIEKQKKSVEKLQGLIAVDENLIAVEENDTKKMLLELIELGGPNLLEESIKTIEKDHDEDKN